MSLRLRIPHHWRGKKFRYLLLVSRCNRCGTVHHNPRTVCRKCRSTELRTEQLPLRGRLLAYTAVRQAPPELEELAPYIVGVVELEDGTKIVSQITDCEMSELGSGMEVEQVVRKISEDGEHGLIVYGYKFRPKIV